MVVGRNHFTLLIGFGINPVIATVGAVAIVGLLGYSTNAKLGGGKGEGEREGNSLNGDLARKFDWVPFKLVAGWNREWKWE